MKINHKNKIWIYVLLLVLTVLSLLRYEHFAGKRHFGDFHVYYVTGERLLERSEIYIEKEDSLTPFKYSPIIASWFALLAYFPESWAAGIWHVLNLLMLFACVYVSWIAIAQTSLFQKEKDFQFQWRTVTIGLFCVSPSILHCLNSGQVGFAISLFFYLGVFFSLQKQDAKSAFFFALACMFKYLPLIVIPYFLFQRKFRFVAITALALIGLHVVPALWLGWNQNLYYLNSFIPHITATTLDHVSLLDFKNQSVWAYLYRLIYFDLGIFQIADHLQRLTWFGGGLLAAIYGMIVMRRNQFTQMRILIDFAAIGILIVIFNPNAWKHNFVLLILPCMLVTADWFRSPKLNLKLTALISVSLAFFLTNRSVLGWNLRYDIMSLSILPLASLFLILVLFTIATDPHSLSKSD